MSYSRSWEGKTQDEPETIKPENKKILKKEWAMPTDIQASLNELPPGLGTICALGWIMITEYSPLRGVGNMCPLRNYVISVKFDEEQDIHNSKVPPLKNGY